MGDTTDYNLSMAGCGFLGIYHIGVAAALEKYVPDFKDRKMAGASAGAMAGVYFLCGVPAENTVFDILNLCRIARSKTLGLFNPTVNVTEIFRKSMERHLPENAHEIVNGKIHVSMTRCSDFKNVVISHFESKEDLIQAVICSGFIPVFCGWRPPLFRGQRYMDGGYSDNHPILDENTITVSPFSGESDICPKDPHNPAKVFNMMMISNTSFQFSRTNFSRVSSALFPAKPEILFNTCEQGYADTIKFLIGNDMIQCLDCRDGNNNNQKDKKCDQCKIQKESARTDSLPIACSGVLKKISEKDNSKSTGWFESLSNVTSTLIESTTFSVLQYTWCCAYLR